MSQQINGVVGVDALKDIKKEDTSFEFQINKIPLHTVGGICSSTQMESVGSSSQNHGHEAEVSVKLELYGGDEKSDREVSGDKGALVMENNRPEVENQGSGVSCSDSLPLRDLVSAKDRGANLGPDNSGDNVTDRFTDGSFDRDCSGDSERAKLYETPYSGLPHVARKRPVGRPKGKRSAERADLSFEHYRSENANSPGCVDFRTTDVGTPILSESRRTVVTEKRKRGRPRGSRASGRGVSSFEGRVVDDFYSGASDSGDTEATGSNFSDSGIGGGVISPHTVAVRGALRPGCKSYRGRAASVGRGFRLDYVDDMVPAWDIDAGVVPMEYESALSPASVSDISAKKRLSLPDRLSTPSRTKRGPRSRGRSRGRPRGRRPRASFDHDSAMDNDSSDIGTPGLDASVLSATDAESPNPSVRTESDTDTPVSSSKYRRGRGRGSRGRGIPSSPGTKVQEDKIVTCAVCKDTMTQTTFAYHKLRTHNGCTWREGIDEPLDLNNDKVVKALLKQTLQKRKQLTCEKCGISRSSLAGYESHITFCAKSEGERDALMETCPVCSRRMMPSSLKVHMGVHRQEEKTKLSQENLDSSMEGPFDPGEGSSTSTGKIKRAAANRAVSLMQSVIKGEDLETEEVSKKKAPISLELSEMYGEKREMTAEEGDDSSGMDKKSNDPTLYQVAAWMRTVQRRGKANCKNLGCSFSSAVREELIQHYKSCEFKPKVNYFCKLCNFGCEEEEVMKKHAQVTHLKESDGEEEVENLSESESLGTGEVSGWDSEDLEMEGEDGLERELDDIKPAKRKKRERKPKEKPKEKVEKVKEEDGKTPRNVKYTKNVSFLAKHGLYHRSGLQAYLATLRWNLDFQLSNFSILPLYTEWKTFAKDWVLLSKKDVDAYLPKARISSKFATMNIFYDLFEPKPENKDSLPSFSRLPLFGSSIKSSSESKSSQSGFITMFAGGPVWAQAWCPTPLHISCCSTDKDDDIGRKNAFRPISQFLAVSCTPDFDSYHYMRSRVKGEKCIIQIWDCGPLSNLENTELVSPSMALGIAHDFGPVWALEWCPSGCYDLETGKKPEGTSDSKEESLPSMEKPLRRLGLLAAACGDGTVRIFSVPFPSELTKKNAPGRPSKTDCPSSDTANAKCGSQSTQGKSGGDEVSSVDRTGVSDTGDDDGEVCVEVEEIIGNNKLISCSVGIPHTKGMPCPSALDKCGVSRSNIAGGESSEPKENTSETDRIIPIFKPSSVITLVVNSCSTDEPSENWQCLCLSWSMLGKSHSVLAAGFSNGLIALWDVNTSSPLLRVTKVQKDGSSCVFLHPYHMFFAHKNSVTALDLACCEPDERSPTGEKFPRYLISGSRDRFIKVWDLQDTAAPLSTYTRGLVTSVAWLTHWMSFVSSVDDSFACGRANSKAQALRSYGYKPSPMLNQNSPVTSVVCSDWLNTFAHGTSAGEACLLSAPQVLLAVESSKVTKDRRMFLFYTELIDLKEDDSVTKTDQGTSECKGGKTEAAGGAAESGGPAVTVSDQKGKKAKSKGGKEKAKVNPNKIDGDVESDDEVSTEAGHEVEFKESPRTYADAVDKYGILFCDCAVDQEAGKLPKQAMWILQQTERMKTIPVDLYPISAVNKMCWNPNLQSCIWVASGHQSGLVRIVRVQKTRNRVVELFEVSAIKKIRQVFMQRSGSSS